MLLLFYSFESCSHNCKLMVFHWCLSDSKSSQISSTLLSILADLKCWSLDGLLLSQFSCPWPILWRLLQVHQLQFVSPPQLCLIFFVFSQGLDTYLFSLSFNFTLWSTAMAEFTIQQAHFFVDYHVASLLAKIRWCACISKSQQRNFSSFISVSRPYSMLCIYYSFIWSN